VAESSEPRARGNDPPSDLAPDVVKRLGDRHGFDRYRMQGEVARGAQGAVLRVWDEDLRRDIAMKVMLDKVGGAAKPTPAVSSKALARFLEEAQVTGQLEHPGVVPVHEMGVDPEGRVYFTMGLVKGQSLSAVLALVRQRKDGWTITRALSVLQRVCETVAYAHSKGVVHRDLKPSNVLIGAFGAAYVIDWGLARVLDRPDTRDIRLQGEPRPAAVGGARPGRGGDTSHRPDSPLVTMDGDVVGTPAYMSPEQARGEIEHVGRRSDVYSLGSILYELLSGTPPYTPPEARLSPHVVWRFVLDGPPTPVEELAPDQPPELLAICRKAMAREADDRYARVHEMAEDLRAFLEDRVVKAYRTGAIVELRKWVARNRATAAALAAVVLVALLGALGVAWKERERAREELRFSEAGRITALQAEQRDGFLVDPREVPRMESWLRRSEAVLAREPAYRRELERIRARAAGSEERRDPAFLVEAARLVAWQAVLDARPTAFERKRAILGDAGESEVRRERARRDLEILEADTPRLRAELEELRARVEERERTWRFEDEATRRRHDDLTELLLGFDQLRAQTHRVREDLGSARELERTTIDERRDAWERARADIAASELYAGRVIAPQVGLVPLEPNEFGLWEFWHALSGEAPVRGADGRLVVAEATAIVLVLVPGGTFWMGAQRGPGGPNHDAHAAASEGPPIEVPLDPYFLSKYEMTQGQWRRLVGSNPSGRFAGSDWGGYGTIGWTHPVERVAWLECERVLRRYGLALPTEAQWERAARAGEETAYVFGDTAASLGGRVNAYVGGDGGSDGHPFHAPVDSFEPNAFGLFNVSGNVLEWCGDWFRQSYAQADPKPGDGELGSEYPFEKSLRGGGFRNELGVLRVANRFFARPLDVSEDTGVRPARPLDVD